jgi:hypothetical protein
MTTWSRWRHTFLLVLRLILANTGSRILVAPVLVLLIVSHRIAPLLMMDPDQFVEQFDGSFG